MAKQVLQFWSTCEKNNTRVGAREREREREIAFGEDRRRTRWCLSIFYYKLVHLETERAKERERDRV